MKTLRASVSFPPALHTALKVAVATAVPRVTLTEFVLRIVAASGSISDGAIMDASDTLGASGRVIRSTVTFPSKVASSAHNRAIALGLSPSEFIAAVVAHKLSQNGK